jgi:hypothetical protein
MQNLAAQEWRPQLQVGLAVDRQAKSRTAASFAPCLMELVSDDVKSVALAKIRAVKDLDRALAFAESVAQEATLTLKAARLTQVLLIEWGPAKDKAKHCTCSRSFLVCSRFLHVDKKYFPRRKAQSSMQNVGNLIRKHSDDPAVRSV